MAWPSVWPKAGSISRLGKILWRSITKGAVWVHSRRREGELEEYVFRLNLTDQPKHIFL